MSAKKRKKEKKNKEKKSRSFLTILYHLSKNEFSLKSMYTR